MPLDRYKVIDDKNVWSSFYEIAAFCKKYDKEIIGSSEILKKDLEKEEG